MVKLVNEQYAVSPGGGVWAEVVAQPRVVAQLSRAAKAARALIASGGLNDSGDAVSRGAINSLAPHETTTPLNPETAAAGVKPTPGSDATPNPGADASQVAPPGVNLAAMTHAWLFVGPPGSGRSVAAKAFAAALVCEHPREAGCGTCRQCEAVRKGIHPDVTVMTTELVQVTVAEVKDLIRVAYQRPVRGAWRVVIVEDYDRVTEASSNVLLKAIEEPPERTVWLLCAPSASAVLPTIRSRCRLVQLAVPTASAVADLLVRRDEVEDPELAAAVAGESGAHIGRARALAKNPELRARRLRMLETVAGMRSASDACWTAAALVKYVSLEAGARQATDDEAEKSALLRSLGVNPDDPDFHPTREVKAQLKRLEESQKRRHKRLELDTWDRLLEDLGGFYRDAMVLDLGAKTALQNQVLEPLIRRFIAQGNDAETNIARLEAIRQARWHLMHNGQPTLTMEALCLDLTAHKNDV
uniref:DNA polymerase III subunit delta' n=1 Tax=Mobiluncus mulieris TaxID=2052 RepID=UPI000E1B894B